MSKQVDWRETLVTYLHASTVDEAAKTLGVTKTTLHGRLTILRKAGVKIPKKRMGYNSLDRLTVSQLNSMVAKYEKEQNQ